MAFTRDMILKVEITLYHIDGLGDLIFSLLALPLFIMKDAVAIGT